MRLAFITNICPHYRIKTFETLAGYHDVEYYFFSAGREWYWEQKNGLRTGGFHFEYLPGFSIGRTRITLTLPWKLFSGKYEIYIKCINGRFALPITFIVSRLRGKPFILWTGIWMRLNTLSHTLFYPLTRYIYHHADAIVCYGEHVKRFLISEGVQSERIFVAPHAVDNVAYRVSVSNDEKMVLREKLGISPDKKIILYLGRMEEAKGLEYLRDAFASLQRDDTVLLLVGDGSYREALQNFVQLKGLGDQIRFVGHIPPEQTPIYYSLAYVYVLPSITTAAFKEPWGLVVNEAFNQAVPVVVTDAVGAAAGGLVINGYNGFVVREKDAKALAQAVERILENEDLQHELSQHAAQTISGWDNEHMVLGFRQAIDYVIKAAA